MKEKEVQVIVVIILLVSGFIFSGYFVQEEETYELLQLPTPEKPTAQQPPPPPTPVPEPVNRYTDKEVFIVTSSQWDALEFLPLAIWHENNQLKKYPYLILHTEGNNFDPDPIIYFLEDYNPSRITLLGNVPGGFIELLDQQFSNVNAVRVSKNEMLNYWSGIDTVVYSQEDYKIALLGSTLASLIHAPLIVEGSVNDAPSTFQGKEIIVLGNAQCPTRRCTTLFTIPEIQRRILTETNTDKVILTNPQDNEGWGVSLTSDYIGEIQISGFSKESLAAPILAAAKKEAISFAYVTDYPTIDSDFEEELGYFQFKPNYLTIVANPEFIPQDKPDPLQADRRREVDNSVYGDLDGDRNPDMAVGRIYGITVSDTSALIARSLFYDEMSSVDSAAFLWAPDFVNWLSEVYEMNIWAEKIGLKSKLMILGNLDCSLNSDPLCSDLRYNLNDLEDKSVIAYESHGYPLGGGVGNYGLNLNTESLISESINFHNNPIFLTTACSTCAFGKLATSEGGPGSAYDLFCINVLRRGGIAYFGAVEDASQPNSIVREGLLSLYSGKDLGTMLKDFKSRAFYQGTILHNPAHENQDAFFVLLGDPTLKIMEDRSSRLMLQDSITHDSGSKTIKIILPAVSPEAKVPFGFYTQAPPPGIYTSGDSYYNTNAGKIITQYQVTSNVATNNVLNTQQRSAFTYLFSLPIPEVNQIRGDVINYADNTVGATAEGVSFYTDKNGNTWFWFEEVFLTSLDNGVPAREIVITYS